MALPEEREQEPVLALARELRLANERLARLHKACEAAYQFSTDDLDSPLREQVRAANLFVAAIREANTDYTLDVRGAIDRFEGVKA
jgi:hypothetical protein